MQTSAEEGRRKAATTSSAEEKIISSGTIVSMATATIGITTMVGEIIIGTWDTTHHGYTTQSGL